ncbi:hypothetical protein AAH678_26655 [Sodalis endosymbiont of Spalangia cameroni]|uniref:hypothetical protein n=1 Tax=Sodalis praecaptivus TaxID=1239307 RepID=UPI0031F7FDED
MKAHNKSQSPCLTLAERRNLYCSHNNVVESRMTLAHNLVNNHILSVRNIPEVILRLPLPNVTNIFSAIKASRFSCKEIVTACATTACTWQAALLVQRSTQYFFTSSGITSAGSIAIASLLTECVGTFLSQISFMGGIEGETPGFLTAMISWWLYIFFGGVGHAQLGLLARSYTHNEIFGIYADESLVPLIATFETLAFARIKEACYSRDKSLTKWHERVLAQLWDRIVTGGAMRIIANVSSFYISLTLDNYAIENKVSSLEAHRPENQLISTLPTITIAIIPNLRGQAEYYWRSLLIKIYNV